MKIPLIETLLFGLFFICTSIYSFVRLKKERRVNKYGVRSIKFLICGVGLLLAALKF